MIKDRGQLSLNVSFDLQSKLSSSKMIQKDVQQVKIYTPLQNHQDNPVTIEKNTLEKTWRTPTLKRRNFRSQLQ